MTAPYVLLLAGGAGTRFWPASRNKRPKQLLPLTGGAPLLAETARRILPLAESWAHISIATGAHLAAETSVVLPDVDSTNLLIEPCARNTAPCIGWAAARLARRDPDAVLVVLPSDHHIADEAGFLDTVRRAVASAKKGRITTIGIRPTHPETGFGYLETEGAPDDTGTLRGLRFVEKPSHERATEMIESGRFLWNAGMFVFRARDMMDAIRAHVPALAQGLMQIDEGHESGHESEAVGAIFPTLPSVSIDVGVMERLASFGVVPGDFGWNDIGSWQSAHELADKDDRGNALPHHAVLVDAHNNHVVDLRSSGDHERVIALVGVEDLVIVETDDALLVARRDKAQDVKKVVEELLARGKRERT